MSIKQKKSKQKHVPIVLKYIFISKNVRCTGQNKIIMDEHEKSKLIIHEFKILIRDQQKVIR